MAFLLSYAVEGWALHLTWQFYGSHSAYISNQTAKKKSYPQTNNTTSHPFRILWGVWTTPNGFNSVYSSLRTWVCFTLPTCRIYDTCYLQQLAVVPGCRTRWWCSTLAVTKTWAEPELKSNSTCTSSVLCWLLIFTHHDFSADFLYREYRGCIKFSFLLTFLHLK